MTERTLPLATNRQAMATIWSVVREDRGLLALGVLLACISAGIAAASTRLLGVIIDNTAKTNAGSATPLGILLCSSIAVAGISALAARQLLATVVERALTRLRHRTFTAAAELRLSTIERVGTADPLARPDRRRWQCH